MVFIYFLFIAEDATAPNEDNPNVPNTFGATDLISGRAILIKEAIPSPD